MFLIFSEENILISSKTVAIFPQKSSILLNFYSKERVATLYCKVLEYVVTVLQSKGVTLLNNMKIYAKWFGFALLWEVVCVVKSRLDFSCLSPNIFFYFASSKASDILEICGIYILIKVMPIKKEYTWN